MRDPERRPLLLLADHDARLHRPVLQRLGDRLLQMRHGRQHQFERHALRRAAGPASRRTPPCGGGSRCGGCPAAPAAPAAARRAAPARRRSGRSEPSLLDQGMADIAAGRPAQPAIGLRLERQQRQHVIDIAAHRARPARPPRPDRRRDIVDDRNRGIAGAHAPRHAMGEVGAVDDDENIGRGLQHRVGGLRGSAAGSSAAA